MTEAKQPVGGGASVPFGPSVFPKVGFLLFVG